MSYWGSQNISADPYDSYDTNTPIGGDRVVTQWGNFLRYVDVTDPADIFNAVGITCGATNASEVAKVQRQGTKEDSAWNWEIGQPIYLGVNGILTQTVTPEFKFLRIVALPLTPTKIFIRLHPPVLLS